MAWNRYLCNPVITISSLIQGTSCSCVSNKLWPMASWRGGWDRGKHDENTDLHPSRKTWWQTTVWKCKWAPLGHKEEFEQHPCHGSSAWLFWLAHGVAYFADRTRLSTKTQGLVEFWSHSLRPASEGIPTLFFWSKTFCNCHSPNSHAFFQLLRSYWKFFGSF